ncbi:MAG: hypothetical protein PHQ75_10930 [Thermoguttaceae bacterium]|nr:hypothetical protein [Thermoguttaceae bacterium]
MTSVPNPFNDDAPEQSSNRKKKRHSQSLLRGLFAPLFHARSVVMLFVLFTLGILLGVFSKYIFLLALAFFAVYVFERTAGGGDTFDELPEFELFDGLIYYLWFMYVVVVSSLPGIVLAALLSSDIPEQNIVITFLCVPGSFLLLAPILFLSGMLNMSPWVLFNRDVILSLRQLPWVWLRFYLMSLFFGLLISGFSVVAIALTQKWTQESVPPTGQVFIVTGVMVFAYMLNIVGYFRLLGCLARIISDWFDSQEE